MLEIINRYAHGFVFIPVILACKKKGLFVLLNHYGSMTLEQMEKQLGANRGHFQVALRMMQSLNWLECNEMGDYFLTNEAEVHASIPEDILELYDLPIESYLIGNQQSRLLKDWIERSRQRWNIENSIIADFLDGILIIPILLTLHKNNLLVKEQKPLFDQLNPCVREELYELFASKGWIHQKDGYFSLNEAGQFIVERALITGTTASYTFMLSRVSDVLFGDCQAVFQRDTNGHEKHVSRTLNVVASGFQHKKYFADVDDLILSIFNRLPYEEQPKYIADMGCGDGTFLKRVYETIRTKSARGKVLAQYPLCMIGVDYNEKALTATAKTLTDIPHFVLKGDIGNPKQMVEDLRAHGIGDPENILHIRSFLDHDRPFIPPQNLDKLKDRAQTPYQGVYVDTNGQAIPPHVMVQSLVEHFERWSSIVTKHGLIILEVHSLEPKVVNQFLDKSENLHFDAYQAFSMQHLVEADVFLMSAAEVGLFPKVLFSKRYPKTFPFTRINLNCFEKKPYTIRHSYLSDSPALVNLETKCLPEHLRTEANEIQQRLQRFSSGQLILEMNGQIVGVIYTQRITDAKELENTTYEKIPSLHTPQGSVIQILGINILPEIENQGLDAQFLEFMLYWCAIKAGIKQVVSVIRCTNYINHLQIPIEEYIYQRNELGQIFDPMLRFHEINGATIKGIIRDYRQEDRENQGMGVLVEYNFLNYQSQYSVSDFPDSLTKTKAVSIKGNEDLEWCIEKCVCTVLGEQRLTAYAPKRALMEMGLDSLELLELRTLLGERLGVELEPTFFFQCGTPEAITRYFKEQRTKESLGWLIEDCIRTVLGEQRLTAYAPKQALMEMGLDSLELLELRTLLGERFGVDLEPTFFFQYGTPEAITRYFEGETLVEEKDVCGSIPELDKQDIEQASDANFSQSEDWIAIIGTACRFPGDVNSPDEYWSLLQNGIDAIAEVPKSRWDIDQYYDANHEQPGKISTRYGGFLEKIDQFDAQFFRISPREATYIDPQQRILLEENWKALENAGINPEFLAGSQTGVFVGIAFHDYELLQFKRNQDKDFDMYFATGNATSVAAGRLSYFLGCNGPAMTVETACSSSLVAIHLACQSLRNGECDLALASGVNLLLSPELSITFSRAGMLAPDGRCKTFDADANGYVRSEGCGVVVLKRFQKAIADNDKILAVVRGSAINQDGASNGLTAPNEFSQEAVIRKALSAAGVSPTAVSYVEAHGTGTSLGDPIEVKALQTVYGEGRTSDNPLVIGSVKTNIGHTEAAAGIAGLIKVVLSMQNKYIPPHLHFKKQNPYINLDGIPIIIPTEGMDWKLNSSGDYRLAGVSSFGFSGTNAHIILQEPPALVRNRAVQSNRHLLTISAKSEKALRDLAQNYIEFLTSHPKVSLADVCSTANAGRAHFSHRLAVIAESTVELRKQLKVFISGDETIGLVSGQVSDKGPKIAFLFTGQGSQYIGMGRQLYETQTTFKQTLERCDEILRPYLEKPLLSILYPESEESSSIDKTAYTQPALFAIEYALAELWKSWGIEPAIVMGHSVGEYVAACIAGVFSLEDGLKLIATRGRLMQELPEGGEMVAVFADEALVTATIQDYAQEVSIAAVNSSHNTVISGKSQNISQIVAQLKAQGVKAKYLNVSHAFHSPLMEPMLKAFKQVASKVTFSRPRIGLVSNVTGQLATDEIATPEYWCQHTRQPVKFAMGMKTLFKQKCEIFVECGSKPILLGMGRNCILNSRNMNDYVWLPSLRPEYPDWQQMLQSLGELYVRGLSINWSGYYKDFPYYRISLPTYPFQRQRYWIETVIAESYPMQLLLTQGKNSHPLLGRRLH